MANQINISSNPKIDRLTRSYFNDLASEWETKQAIDANKLHGLLSRLNFAGAKTILDVGCGTGALFPHLTQFAKSDAEIFALDFACEMVFEAAKYADVKIRLLCADIQLLPLLPASVDLIIAFQVFPHIKQKELALQQCWQALRENGELAIIHLQGSRELNDFHASLNDAVSDHELPSAEEMKKMFQKHNFEVTYCVDEAEEYFVSGKKRSAKNLV